MRARRSGSPGSAPDVPGVLTSQAPTALDPALPDSTAVDDGERAALAERQPMHGVDVAERLLGFDQTPTITSEALITAMAFMPVFGPSAAHASGSSQLDDAEGPVRPTALALSRLLHWDH
jgi:hypothetical protein